jgi:hypothetical protein
MASTCASPPRAIRWAVSVIARQPSLLFGVVGIVILWVGVLHSLSVERQGALDITVRDTGNFTRAFQEQITGIFRAVDQTLLYVRAAYIRDPDRFDIERWTEHSEFLTDPAFQVSIILSRRGSISATASIFACRPPAPPTCCSSASP